MPLLCREILTLNYFPQHFLYFLPLPQGQGSLRPIFWSVFFGSTGLKRRSRSEISSGLSGSSPIMNFQPCFPNIDATSWSLFSVRTRTTAGFFFVPSLAIFWTPWSQKNYSRTVTTELSSRRRRSAPVDGWTKRFAQQVLQALNVAYFWSLSVFSLEISRYDIPRRGRLSITTSY